MPLHFNSYPLPFAVCRLPSAVSPVPTIGIDASRLTVGERTGTETYTAQLLRAIAADPPPERIRLYLNSREIPPEAAPFEAARIPFPRLWTHARLSWEMLRDPPDLLFVPAHVVPIRHPRTVVTIHDLGYLHEPDAHPPADRRLLDWTTRWSVHAAHRVIAISETTRQDLIRFYGVSEDRIRVVRHGVGPEFRPLPTEAVVATRRRLGLPEHYVLAVGTVQPRKNLAVLAAAMRVVAGTGLPHRLVIAGKRGWLAERVEAEIAGGGMAERVVWAGYVAPDDLPAVYNGAEAFAFPSRYEGFGMPVVEAMACGIPSVVADRAALPEVAGNAALMIDPDDADGLGLALVRLLTDGPLRQRLTRAGISRAASFAWQRTAQETLAVLREALGAKSRE
jgi:glycosyltransferase involved in cell wall biosynthesis